MNTFVTLLAGILLAFLAVGVSFNMYPYIGFVAIPATILTWACLMIRVKLVINDIFEY